MTSCGWSVHVSLTHQYGLLLHIVSHTTCMQKQWVCGITIPGGYLRAMEMEQRIVRVTRWKIKKKLGKVLQWVQSTFLWCYEMWLVTAPNKAWEQVGALCDTFTEQPVTTRRSALAGTWRRFRVQCEAGVALMLSIDVVRQCNIMCRGALRLPHIWKWWKDDQLQYKRINCRAEER